MMKRVFSGLYLLLSVFLFSPIEICAETNFNLYQLTNDNTDDGFPSLYDGTIAWVKGSGENREICYSIPVINFSIFP